VPTATKLSPAALEHAALEHVDAILAHVADRYGRPSFDIERLNPDPPQPRPRMSEFRVVGGRFQWVNYGSGHQGQGMTAFLSWFGSCDRQTATDYLQRLVDQKAAA
jgi:hypothetical protein